MALVDCPDCGKPVSTDAYVCPSCGRPTERQRAAVGNQWKKTLALWLVLVAGLTLAWLLLGPRE